MRRLRGGPPSPQGGVLAKIEGKLWIKDRLGWSKPKRVSQWLVRAHMTRFGQVLTWERRQMGRPFSTQRCGRFTYVCVWRARTQCVHENLLWDFDDKYILSLWFRNDIARSIWTLYVISMSVRVKLCLFCRILEDHDFNSSKRFMYSVFVYEIWASEVLLYQLSMKLWNSWYIVLKRDFQGKRVLRCQLYSTMKVCTNFNRA